MIRLLFIISLFVGSCNGNTSNTKQIDNSQITELQTQSMSTPPPIPPDSLLLRIQNKVYQAFVASLLSHKSDELDKISKGLSDLYKAKNQNIILYWQGYLQYYASIYYLQQNNKKAAENEADKGLNWLKSIKNKNSEDYALLALLQSFSIQFRTGDAMLISQEINKDIENALAIDSSNLRANYVFASNNFYTPKKYGGGKLVEKYLLKAISLPTQKTPNQYLPSWGKEESYEMLIKYYIQNKKWDLAKQYYEKGIKECPKSYIINQLASQLVGK